MYVTHATTSTDENSAQVSYFQIKFAHDLGQGTLMEGEASVQLTSSLR
jgi:hypothetical protein